MFIFYRKNPGFKIATAARKFGITRGTLRRRLDGTGPRQPQHSPQAKLKAAEEKSLLDIIYRLDNLNLSVTKKWITDAANTIIKEKTSTRNPRPNYVGPRWVDNFIKRHQFNVQKGQIRSQDRQDAEDYDTIKNYFDILQKAIAEKGISPGCIWNMDETGFQIGTTQEGSVVTQRKKKTSYRGTPLNRELATSIEAISATGDFIRPPFLVAAGKQHMASWYRVEELPDNTNIAVSDSGYSNDVIGLAWLKFFNQETKKRGSSAARLLIIDGHGSHHTYEFIQYATDNNISIFGLPSHCTHLLQPLDVVIFSPIKHYYSEAINQLVRDGLNAITKIEFFTIIHNVRLRTMQENSIKSAFRNTGIWPYMPSIILDQIKELHPEQFSEGRVTPEMTPPPSNQLFSSPFRTPNNLRSVDIAFRYIKDSAKELFKKEFSEESYRELRAHLARVEAGSTTLAANNIHLSRRLEDIERTQKRAREQKRGTTYRIQKGGILTAEEGRRMVRDREKEDIEKLRMKVERADKKREKEETQARKAEEKRVRDEQRRLRTQESK